VVLIAAVCQAVYLISLNPQSPMIKTLTVLCLCCSIFLTSCAAILNGKRDNLRLNSDPPGANVYVDGDRAGKTPCAYSVDATQDHHLDFRLEGYESVSRMISSSMGAGWLIADVLFSGLIGVIIDASTHSWNSLDQRYVNVALEKK
jgi:hypothetical protein